MRILFTLLTLLALPLAASAIERTVQQPFNATADINRMMMVPICSAAQYVGVTNGKFVCRPIPTCAAGQALTFNNGFNCVSITGTPPTPTGQYVEQSFRISQEATCENDRRAGFTHAPVAGPGLVNIRPANGGRGLMGDMPGEWDMCQGLGVTKRSANTYSLTHEGGFTCSGGTSQTSAVSATCKKVE